MKQRRGIQEHLNSHCFFFLPPPPPGEFWPRRSREEGKHLAITNHSRACFTEVVTFNTVFNWMQHLWLQKSGIPETMGKNSWSLLLLNQRTPSVLNCPKDPSAKLSTEVNWKPSLVYSSLVFLWSLSEEVRTVPSCWIWIMKVLQILWDFLSQLLDERHL